MEGGRVTVRKVAEEFGLSYNTAKEKQKTSKLELKRICVRCVPRLLQPGHKSVRLQISRDLTSR